MRNGSDPMIAPKYDRIFEVFKIAAVSHTLYMMAARLANTYIERLLCDNVYKY